MHKPLEFIVLFVLIFYKLFSVFYLAFSQIRRYRDWSTAIWFDYLEMLKWEFGLPNLWFLSPFLPYQNFYFILAWSYLGKTIYILHSTIFPSPFFHIFLLTFDKIWESKSFWRLRFIKIQSLHSAVAQPGWQKCM